jgi:hypothetical protein
MRITLTYLPTYALAAMPLWLAANAQPLRTGITCPAVVDRFPVSGCAAVHVRIIDRRWDDRIGTYVYWLPQARIGAVGEGRHTRGRDTVTILVIRPDRRMGGSSADTMTVLLHAVQPMVGDPLPDWRPEELRSVQLQSDTARLIVTFSAPGSVAVPVETTVRMRHIVSRPIR